MKNNLKSKMPIGVFDSGIGGLNVLAQAKKLLPNENFIYLGDNANSPYGNKSIQDLKILAKNSVEQLLSYNVKAIVIACNTLSTTLYGYIKRLAKVPVIPTYPLITNNLNNVTLMATPNTIKSNYVKLHFKKANLLPLPFLAQEIENNILNGNNICMYKDIKGLSNNTNVIVLGCTHYSFIKEIICDLTGKNVVDGIENTVINLKNTLKKKKLLNNVGGVTTFIGNSKNYNFQVFMRIFGDGLAENGQTFPKNVKKI